MTLIAAEHNLRLHYPRTLDTALMATAQDRSEMNHIDQELNGDNVIVHQVFDN